MVPLGLPARPRVDLEDPQPKLNLFSKLPLLGILSVATHLLGLTSPGRSDLHRKESSPILPRLFRSDPGSSSPRLLQFKAL